MADVKDVAAFFVALASQQNSAGIGDLITDLRLQKLLYFAQGACLARYGHPLFDAQIEAWEFGPVVPEIYQTYKKYGRLGIDCPDEPAPDSFTPEEYELLLDVALEYEQYSTASLVRMSHAPDAPWSSTPRSAVISNDAIREYFSKKKLPSFDDVLDGYPVEVIP